jgi:PUA domain protein
VDHIPVWFITQIPNQAKGKLTPFLPVLSQLINKTMQLPEVVVDMGAVPYVARGADIMAPGIVEIDESLGKDMFAVITDIRNHKPLGIGIMLRERKDILKNRKGKALESIHYVGDKIWKIIQSI